MNDTSFWQSVAATPWWIYVLFGYSAYVCHLASKPREMHIQSFYLLPSLFIALTTMTVCAQYTKVNLSNFTVWIDMTTLGTGLGYLHFQFLKVKAVQDTYILSVPGTYLPLFFLTIATFCKFYFRFSLALDQNFLFQAQNLPLFLVSYGFMTGIFLGRLGYALRCIKKAAPAKKLGALLE